MPRRPRLLIEGGLYHVYNRCARGEPVFGDPQEAIEFVELIRAVKERDGLTVYAWALLSNHFHLAVRTSVVPLSRTMKNLQGSYSRAFNRRWRRTGPLWQSRYQARLVEDQRYFDQLMVYIHLNPVRAGLVSDAAEYVFSGHRELLGKVSSPLVDVDEALVATVGIERWGQRAGALATVLQKHPDGVSRWVNRGARLRGKDVALAKATAELDEELSRKALERFRAGAYS